jgi:hypothetical protein
MWCTHHVIREGFNPALKVNIIGKEGGVEV